MIGSTLRHLRIEVDGALALSEQIEILALRLRKSFCRCGRFCATNGRYDDGQPEDVDRASIGTGLLDDVARTVGDVRFSTVCGIRQPRYGNEIQLHQP